MEAILMRMHFSPLTSFGFTCLVASVCIASCSLSLKAEKPDEVLKLWPHEPPGGKVDTGTELDMTKDSDKLIADQRIIRLGNVSEPEAHVYLPPVNFRSGASVLICPGGGFSILAWDLEGTEVAQWLVARGITAVVLKYRVPTRTQPQSWLAPTQDAQRAISMIRSRADEWKLDRSKVAILGFSAGGATAIKVSLAPKRYYDTLDPIDSEDCLPNRSILIYAAGLPEGVEPSTIESMNITKSMPPMFMVHAFDDFVPVQGTVNLLLAMKKMAVPAELHVYSAGGHGYGLRSHPDFPVTGWTVPCTQWLEREGWIFKPK
jgi:acetyl esterase/lipase